jgi:SAM-dependent methyltransferase
MSLPSWSDPNSPLDTVNDPFRPGGVALTERGLALCNLPGRARVWDIGCGSAVVADQLTTSYGYRAVGLDLSMEPLRAARRRNKGLPLVQSTGFHIPAADASLDAILTECALSLVNEPAGCFAEFGRVVKPGGWLVMNDLYTRVAESSHPVAALSKADLIDMIEASGFKIWVWEDHTDELRRYAAQLLWAGQSLARFDRRGSGLARPGYYLLVARKCKD